jgi:hypothetical protein
LGVIASLCGDGRCLVRSIKHSFILYSFLTARSNDYWELVLGFALMGDAEVKYLLYEGVVKKMVRFLLGRFNQTSVHSLFLSLFLSSL